MLEGVAKQGKTSSRFGCEDVGIVCFLADTPCIILGVGFSHNTVADFQECCLHIGAFRGLGVGAAQNYVMARGFPDGVIKKADTWAYTFLIGGVTCGYDMWQGAFVVEQCRFDRQHVSFGTRITDISTVNVAGVHCETIDRG